MRLEGMGEKILNEEALLRSDCRIRVCCWLKKVAFPRAETCNTVMLFSSHEIKEN